MSLKPKILIVDDEQTICFSLRTLFENKGYETFEASDATTALAMLKGKKKKPLNPDVVLLDVQLPDINGLQVLQEIRDINPEINVIIITGFGSIPQSVEAMQKGAVDYVLKPFNIEELILRVSKALESRDLRQEVTYLKKEVKEQWDNKFIIGPNPTMAAIFENLEKIATSPSTTVFIHGETGTGKEVIASRIHFMSHRASSRFVAINATALTADLLESELFGHESGAFTGAVATKKGLFEVADGGTLFLDEIGDMDLGMQAKILRALQERSIRRVGGTENIPVDIRLITATNKNLEESVKEGTFREDLYYRLNVVPIYLPALRHRTDDIEALASNFIQEFNREFGRHVKGMSPDALDALQKYQWPGNVRELRNLIERSMLLDEPGEVLEAAHLKFSVGGTVPSKGEGPAAAGGAPGIVGQSVPLETVERQHIEGVLSLTKGNKNQAAQILGIDRTTLYNKLKKYQIGTV